MTSYTDDYWHAVMDDALSDRPVILQCDACGRDYPVAADEPDDEVRLCVPCTLAAVRTAMNTPPLAA